MMQDTGWQAVKMQDSGGGRWTETCGCEKRKACHCRKTYVIPAKAGIHDHRLPPSSHDERSEDSHEVCAAKPDRLRNAQPFRIA